MTFRPSANRVLPSTRSSLFHAALMSAVMATAPAATLATAASPPTDTNHAQLFGVRPMHEGQTTLPGGHFSFDLVPGQSISDGVVVENFSNHSLDFHIYGADLLSASGGGFAPAQAGATMHEAGAWISMSTPKVSIPAHGQFTDEFTLTLPTTVSPGEHRGTVVAAATVGLSPGGSNIEARTALITVITVPGALKPSASLSALTRSAAGPQHLGFEIVLSNTGNLLLTYMGAVQIYDGAGRKVASLPLTPADSYVVPAGHMTLAALWKDPIPRSGNYSAQATVTILAKETPVTTLTSGSLALSFSSWPLFQLRLGIALGTLFFLTATWAVTRRVRRRRRSRGRATRDAERGAALGS